MAEAETTPEGGSTPDQITNLKGEFNRKLENQSNILAELKKQNETLLARVTQMATPPAKPAAADDEDFEALAYSKPAEAIKIQAARSEKAILDAIDTRSAAQGRLQQTMNQLVTDFPELQDNTSPLYKAALENYGKLTPEEQKSPTSYRVAALDAAMELGLKRKSQRGDDQEEFAGPSGSQSVSRGTRRSKSDPVTDAWAELMEQHTGVDLTSDAAKKRISDRQGREWGKYREPVDFNKKKKGSK